MTAEDVKRLLHLEPHLREGGWFRQTYAAEERIPADAFAHPYPSSRRVHTAIYYLLEAEMFSEMHRLRSDEVFHHYAGAPVEMLQLQPNGRGEKIVIGPDLMAGQWPQVMVPRNVWQGSRLLPGLGLPEWPEWSGLIEALTHR